MLGAQAQRGGKAAIHVMLMRLVIGGDKVPLGGLWSSQPGRSTLCSCEGDECVRDVSACVFAGVAVNWQLGFRQWSTN